MDLAGVSAVSGTSGLTYQPRARQRDDQRGLREPQAETAAAASEQPPTLPDDTPSASRGLAEDVGRWRDILARENAGRTGLQAAERAALEALLDRLHDFVVGAADLKTIVMAMPDIGDFLTQALHHNFLVLDSGLLNQLLRCLLDLGARSWDVKTLGIEDENVAERVSLQMQQWISERLCDLLKFEDERMGPPAPRTGSLMFTATPGTLRRYAAMMQCTTEETCLTLAEECFQMLISAAERRFEQQQAAPFLQRLQVLFCLMPPRQELMASFLDTLVITLTRHQQQDSVWLTQLADLLGDRLSSSARIALYKYNPTLFDQQALTISLRFLRCLEQVAGSGTRSDEILTVPTAIGAGEPATLFRSMPVELNQALEELAAACAEESTLFPRLLELISDLQPGFLDARLHVFVTEIVRHLIKIFQATSRCTSLSALFPARYSAAVALWSLPPHPQHLSRCVALVDRYGSEADFHAVVSLFSAWPGRVTAWLLHSDSTIRADAGRLTAWHMAPFDLERQRALQLTLQQLTPDSVYHQLMERAASNQPGLGTVGPVGSWERTNWAFKLTVAWIEWALARVDMISEASIVGLLKTWSPLTAWQRHSLLQIEAHHHQLSKLLAELE